MEAKAEQASEREEEPAWRRRPATNDSSIHGWFSDFGMTLSLSWSQCDGEMAGTSVPTVGPGSLPNSPMGSRMVVSLPEIDVSHQQAFTVSLCAGREHRQTLPTAAGSRAATRPVQNTGGHSLGAGYHCLAMTPQPRHCLPHLQPQELQTCHAGEATLGEVLPTPEPLSSRQKQRGQGCPRGPPETEPSHGIAEGPAGLLGPGIPKYRPWS